MQYRFTKEDWVAVVLFAILANLACQFVALKLLDIEIYFAIKTLNLGVLQTRPYLDVRHSLMATFWLNVFLVLLGIGVIILL